MDMVSVTECFIETAPSFQIGVRKVLQHNRCCSDVLPLLVTEPYVSFIVINQKRQDFTTGELSQVECNLRGSVSRNLVTSPVSQQSVTHSLDGRMYTRSIPPLNQDGQPATSAAGLEKS